MTPTTFAPPPQRTSQKPATYGLDPSTPRFTVEQYQKMIDAGIFVDGPRIELLEGFLVLKMTKSALHDGVIQILNRRLLRLLPHPWDVRVQSVIQLTSSEPEPDLVVVSGFGEQFVSRVPSAADAGIVMEVSDSSLRRDEVEKAALYADAGIPCYWIVNLVDRCVEVYTDPAPTGAEPAAYRSVERVEAGQEAPLILGGAQVGVVATTGFFPKP